MKSSRLLIAASVAALLPLRGAFAQSPTPPTEEPATQPAQQPAQQQGATFESLDTNSDGRISKDEAAVNSSVTEQFSRYDKNGNGFIEREEVSASNTTPTDPAKQ
jgi:Ca2+-binding EF-hand superfamily protein